MKKDIEWLKKEIEEYLAYEGVRYARIALESVLGYIDQLDEPEKVVIPKFVADWIDTHNLYGNNPLREYRDLESDFNEGWTDEKDAAVYHWVNKNPYAFIDALRYGYDAEKEKLYTVDLPPFYELIKLLHTQTYRIKNYSESGFGDYTNTFTEAEINSIDERYWAFAEEVKPCN
ncbi:DUF1642 domain-containing protein [Jeotgalibaca porci]|uniref:DUF1642 domain-containing protein n=1 Tax=Jeotgalibaca porci TaxID=1868793 RepID=UPI00359F5FC1